MTSIPFLIVIFEASWRSGSTQMMQDIRDVERTFTTKISWQELDSGPTLSEITRSIYLV